MNLLEHYIERVVSIEDFTNNFQRLCSTVNEPVYKIEMVVNCYGCRTTEEVIWRKSTYETNIQRGYYFA